MTTDMGPPLPRTATTAAAAAVSEATNGSTEIASSISTGDLEIGESAASTSEHGLKNPSDVDIPKSEHVSVSGDSVEVETKREQRSNNVAVPYTIPSWSGTPCHPFFVEVLKDGAIVEKFHVNKKGAYMFGRVDLCDFVLEHPTISRFHAVLQFRSNGDAYLYDLSSTHGTFINKNEVKKRVYVNLHVGDVIRFGHSSRLYIFQGPAELMPQETDMKSSRGAKIRQDVKDMEASLLRAKLQASLADGISWGMQEDAIEDNEDEVDEITWQNYKGQLTEKQEKTKEKVIKRLEKIGHMKKEIDAIRAKDISQGGLTQGQQTQIARNEQRISQLMEELENLEETLNDSIRESVSARTGRFVSHRKKQGISAEEDDDFSSDDDDFYDRTKKPSKQKTSSSAEIKSVETADSLLDKKEALLKQIEERQKSLPDTEKPEEVVSANTEGDALDAYMSTVSSQLVLDAKGRVEKELSGLRSELDRILYFLRVADPTGEASRKRESSSSSSTAVRKDEKPKPSPLKEADSEPEGASSENAATTTTTTATVFTATKPQWLGAVEDRIKPLETAPQVDPPTETQETDEFVDYKDRKEILTKSSDHHLPSSLEEAGPGLLIRKRKSIPPPNGNAAVEVRESEFKAEDAVALLLRHSRGYHEWEDDEENDDDGLQKPKKRVIGPERPSSSSSSVLRVSTDYDSWVPPEGQSGDGRTSLNERFGY